MGWDAETLDALDRLALTGAGVAASVASTVSGRPMTPGTLSVTGGPPIAKPAIASSTLIVLVGVAVLAYVVLR